MGILSIILGLCPKGFKPSNSLFKGAIRAYGLSIAAMAALPVNSGPASDDASLDDLFGAEEEQDKAQEHKQQVERLGTEIFLVKDDGAENEGNEDAAAPYH